MAKRKSFDVPKKDGIAQKEHCISGILLFLYETEILDKLAPMQILKTTDSKSKLDNGIFFLQGG